MPDLTYRALSTSLKPLAEKFYRAQRSAMRSHPTDRIWVAQRDDIVAALCLRPVESGVWLTSLLVAPPLRGRGIASGLIEQALRGCSEPVWLFCHPQLATFYLRLGFAPCAALPQSLTQRLRRYQNNKQLIALVRAPAP
jgi:N-acetylglutamate synthase-like GNAT family acetyltransferase